MDLDVETQQISYDKEDKDDDEEEHHDKKDKKDHKDEKPIVIEEKEDIPEKPENKEEKKPVKKDEVVNVLAHGLLQNRKIFAEDTDFKDIENSNDKEWNCLVYNVEGKWEKVYKEIKFPEREKPKSRSIYQELNNEEEVDSLIKTYEFDHNRWLDVYKQSLQNIDPNNKNKSRFLRLLVQLETKQNMLDFCYHLTFTIGKENVKKDSFVKLPKGEIKKSIKGTEYINEKPPVEEKDLESRKLVEVSNINFVHSDSIAAGLYIKNEKKGNPLVLVFANSNKAGNGTRGGDGQEEDIFRRTTLAFNVDAELARSVVPDHKFEYSVKECKVLYCPGVFVFRKYISEGFAYMIPDRLDFILCNPILKPKLDGSHMTDKEQVEKLEKQIRTILTVALEKKHDSVVLGAFGCGYSKGSPKAVLKVTKKIIQTEFPHTFKYVTFAVIEEEQNPQDKANVEVFKHVIDVKHGCSLN